MQESEYRAILADVGFDAIDVEITREYGTEEGCAAGSGIGALIMSAFIRARKPTSSGENV